MLATITTKLNGTTTRLIPAAMGLLLAMTVPAFAQEMKVPQTSADHQQVAERYQKIETQTREDIEMHKKMLVEFNQTVAKSPKSGENPYTRKMRLHCEKYIKAAEGLAEEARVSAKFHALRAKELEGK